MRWRHGVVCATLLIPSCAQEYDVTQRVDVDPDDVTECDFEEVDDARGFSRYTCNPVFETSGEEWSEVLIGTTFLEAPVVEHAFYQIWYAGVPEGGDGGDIQVGTAVSAEGTEWIVHDDNPGWFGRSSDAWDGLSMQRLKVAWDDERLQYRMLYGGISEQLSFGLGTAASADGVEWAPDPANPVLSFGGPVQGVDYAWAAAYEVVDGRHNALLAGAERGEERLDLWRVEGDDPAEWAAVDPVRVLRAGDDGAFDDQGFIDAAVVELDEERWLFYVGFAERIDQGDTWWANDTRVGVARWEDGGWVRLQDEAFPLHNTDVGEVSAIAARPVGSRIHVWLTDRYPELDDDREVNAVGYFVFDPEAW